LSFHTTPQRKAFFSEIGINYRSTTKDFPRQIEMDTQLEKLMKLWRQHGNEPFQIDDVKFFLSTEGRLWLNQVSEHPMLATFSDHGWAVINSNKTSK
jgi:hypothetical protein